MLGARAIRPGALVVVLAASIALAAISAPQSTAAERPSLRLIAPDSGAKARLQGGRIRLNLGLYVAAGGADFQVELERPDYGRWRMAQVDAETGAPLRALPERLLADGEQEGGLDRFLRLSFRKPGGREVAVRRLDFCPNSFERQRVDATSAQRPRYPLVCAAERFPFTKGDVWGIERGWAVPAGRGSVRARALRPGRYRIVAEIRDAYRRAFAIPRSQGRVVLDVSVKKRRGNIRIPFPISNGRRQLERLTAPQAPLIENPDPATLPDLVALPAWNITTRVRGGRELLAFSSTPWNAGPASLDVEGFRREGEQGVMDAFQYFFDPDGRVSGRGRVGEMKYDTRDGHGHWHLKQLVRYRLLDSSRERATRSHKQSFCIAPTDPIDLTLPGAALRPAVFSGGFGPSEGSICGRRESTLWIRQRLDAGWGDTYLQMVPGQAFDITGLPNGVYYVEVEVNPGRHLFEVSADNNVELRKIRLRGQGRDRVAIVRPWRGLDA